MSVAILWFCGVACVPRPRLALIVLAGLAVAALAARPLRRVVWTVVRVPLSIVESTARVVALLPRLPSLLSDHAALHARLAAQQLELLHAREALRLQAQRLDADTTHLVRASILVPPLLPTQHMITLDRGSRTGLAIDMVLLAPDGLVGRVVEVYPTTGVAMLLTDPNSRIACRIERSREVGLLTGAGQRLCRLIYLDVEADVTVGDRVVTAGIGGSWMKGLIVGTVESVHQQPHASPAVWVKPAVTLSRLEDVWAVPPASASAAP